MMEEERPVLYLIPCLLAEDTHDAVLPPGLKQVVASTRVFLAEDIRSARRFISSLKLGISIESLRFIELNKDTRPEEITPFLKNLKENAGVISEAGCPGIADPGALAVDIAHSLDIRVVPLTGPSSILLALMASGMNGQSFVFHGYLPIERDERLRKLKVLEKDAQSKQQTQIFIETPYRNNQMLESILSQLNPSLKLCIACRITAPDEYIRTLTIAGWKKGGLPDLHKKPCIFLLG